MNENPFDELEIEYQQDPPDEPDWWDLIPVVDSEVIPSNAGTVVPMPYIPETLYELYS